MVRRPGLTVRRAGADGPAAAAAGIAGGPESGIPLLSGRGLVDGLPAAYVCRGFTCRLPVTSADDLLTALRH